MSKVCHIVGGGDFFGIRPTGEGDFIIAADKGLLYLQNLGAGYYLVQKYLFARLKIRKKRALRCSDKRPSAFPERLIFRFFCRQIHC